MEYRFSNAVTGVNSSVTEVLLDENVPVDLDGEEVTRYFEVGVTEVIYTLVDQYGNTSTCGFTVTINDTEPPVFTNGCPNLVANLDGGECYASISSYPEITDNASLIR